MIRADIPESNYGANVQVRIPMPRSAVSVTTELVGTAGTGRPVAAGLTTSGQVRMEIKFAMSGWMRV